mmetsp:Transcript_40624/g.61901  ORF Transcript_40624/g.61901 Transcript_40624/m.61901 type:complete len:247 (-) Transcript_40624:590-1330(-)
MSKEGQMPGSWRPVYKSENKKKDRFGYQWTRVFTDTDTLADDNDNGAIQIQVFAYNNKGNHQKLATYETTLGEMKQSGKDEKPLEISSSGGNSKVTIERVMVSKKETFLDYIFGGCEIGLQVAIDFTLSNGDVTNPHSLHYWNEQSNQYLQTIRSVGQVLENYDSDKKYPLYGFGGRYPGGMQVSHCFALNGDCYDPEVKGVEGIVKAYKNSLSHCPLYGPTHFSGVLETVNDYCKSKKDELSQYN